MEEVLAKDAAESVNSDLQTEASLRVSTTPIAVKKDFFSLDFFKNYNFKDSYGAFVLGAIVVVILGLLFANFITKKSGDIGSTGDKITSAGQTGQAATTSSPNVYRVSAGDSLSAISMKAYGNFDYWPVLAKVNNIANPDVIFVDSTVKIPAKVEADAMKADLTAAKYTVSSGDTLFTIAEKLYGDGSKWTLLDKANNIGRLPNGNPLIFAGNVLVVPR